MRKYRKFSFKEANFRISSSHVERIIQETKHQRALLEAYIERQQKFATALSPVELLPEAPAIARRMHEASLKTGVGPMAAVAGAMAQMGAEAALAAGAEEAIVENGGDIYLISPEKMIVGLYAGTKGLSGKLAFHIQPAEMPAAVCSSSSPMGHSLSFGDCDLATVVARDAALADAAATLACNLVQRAEDIPGVLDRVNAIQGIRGVLIVKAQKVGLAGELPRLIRHTDREFRGKITRGTTCSPGTSWY